MTGSKLFTPEMDKAIVKAWPEAPKIKGFSRTQVRSRAKYIGLRLHPVEAKARSKESFIKVLKRHEKWMTQISQQSLARKKRLANETPITLSPSKLISNGSDLFTTEHDMMIRKAWPKLKGLSIPGRSAEQIYRRARVLKLHLLPEY